MVRAFHYLFSLFLSSARGQITAPISTSDILKRVYLRELHSFWG